MIQLGEAQVTMVACARWPLALALLMIAFFGEGQRVGGQVPSPPPSPSGGAAGSAGSTGSAGANGAALEALRRLKGMDFEGNPALKGALMRVVDSTRGTPAFVELVRDFELKGEEDGLLEVAAKHPGDPAAPEAIRLLLESGGLERMRKAWQGADSARQAAWTEATAQSADPRGIPILVEAVSVAGTSTPSRATAIRGLARTEAGARVLLRLAGEGVLDEPARTTASLSLAQSRWPEIRREALKILPPPKSADGGELPSVSELVGLRGDVARGATIFQSEKASCSKCHLAGAVGMDFGPALTQIGTKLGRQALYESILDPSSGISFGYEGWSVETRGGEEVFGILASETAEELAIKQQTGAVVRLKKSEVLRRERQKLSVMPAGLASVLSRQELVDLVEFLTTLKGP